MREGCVVCTLSVWLAGSSHHAMVFSANGLCKNTGAKLQLFSAVAATTVMQLTTQCTELCMGMRLSVQDLGPKFMQEKAVVCEA